MQFSIFVLTLCELQAEAGDKANQVLTPLPTRRAQLVRLTGMQLLHQKGVYLACRGPWEVRACLLSMEHD